MTDPNNKWHPWQLRPAEGHKFEILLHNGWQVWGEIHANASEFEIRAEIERAQVRRDEWLAGRARNF